MTHHHFFLLGWYAWANNGWDLAVGVRVGCITRDDGHREWRAVVELLIVGVIVGVVTVVDDQAAV